MHAAFAVEHVDMFGMEAMQMSADLGINADEEGSCMCCRCKAERRVWWPFWVRKPVRALGDALAVHGERDVSVMSDEPIRTRLIAR